MHHEQLPSILVALLAAIALVPIFQRLHVGPVLGYLIAGLAIGPFGIGVFSDPHEAEPLAEFGVVFLLFAIGLELPFERLRAMRFYIFGLGSSQVLATGILIGLAAWVMGADPAAAMILGGTLALSSTAAVLKLLVDRGEAAARFGRVAVAVLLFQDLAVVPLLVLIPLLALKSTGAELAMALGLAAVKAVFVLAAILAAGRYLIRPLFRMIAGTGNAEIFTATTLFLLLGIGWATEAAGMSMALGAFLAGILIAGTPYRHQVEADIQPFRGLLLGLFFMTVGMGIDPPAILDRAGQIAAITLGLIAIKAAVLVALAPLFGLSSATGVRVGLLLAQGGEFAFVLLNLAGAEGVLNGQTVQGLNAAVLISIALTPLLDSLGARIGRAIRNRGGARKTSLAAEAASLESHVLVAGYGRVGQGVCRLLESEGNTYVALDLDVQRVISARNMGHPVYFGDASRVDVLRAAGIEKARLAVIAIDDPPMAERLAAAIHTAAEHLPIVARAWDSGHAQRLQRLGVTRTVSEDAEISLAMGERVLSLLGSSEAATDKAMLDFRDDEAHRIAEARALDDQRRTTGRHTG